MVVLGSVRPRRPKFDLVVSCRILMNLQVVACLKKIKNKQINTLCPCMGAAAIGLGLELGLGFFDVVMS